MQQEAASSAFKVAFATLCSTPGQRTRHSAKVTKDIKKYYSKLALVYVTRVVLRRDKKSQNNINSRTLYSNTKMQRE